MGFLKNIFTKQQALPPANLGVLRADMHSHLIPGIDDGAQTIENSILLIRELHKLGYKKLITTPHIMSDHYKNTPEIILSGLEKVKKALKEENIPMEMEAAAEYYFDFDFEQKVDKQDLLTFGDNYVLFELSMINEPDFLNRIVFKLKTTGYRPVLAHVERYPYWYDKKEQYEKLVDLGLLLQLNINSLAGQYSPRTRRVAQNLVDRNMIDFLGTDCHNMDYVTVLKKCLTDHHLHKALASGKLLNAGL